MNCGWVEVEINKYQVGYHIDQTHGKLTILTYFSIISMLVKYANISAQRSSAGFHQLVSISIPLCDQLLRMPSHFVEIICWLPYSFYVAFS